MKNSTETPQTLEDLLFEHRNKSYGAFDLRQRYTRHIKKAAVVGTSLVAFGLIGPTIYAKFMPPEVQERFVLADPKSVPPPPTDEKVETPPPPPEMLQPVETVQHLTPLITIDELVPEDTPPVHTQDELEGKNLGSEDIEGVAPNPNDLVVIEDPVPAPIPIEIKPIDEDGPVVIVEQQPEFVGGMKALYEFLQKNIKYPSAAARSGIQGKVFVSFTVGREGELSNVSLIKGIGFGCDEEAERVVKLMPRWLPGKQSGRAVRVKYTLPIAFMLE